MIKETFELIVKNFKLILRSKMSILMLVLVPALLIFLLGLAFGQSSSYTLSMGIYSEKYSELTNSFVDQLNEKNFRVTKHNTEWDCIEAIKDGKSNICVKFPPD